MSVWYIIYDKLIQNITASEGHDSTFSLSQSPSNFFSSSSSGSSKKTAFSCFVDCLKCQWDANEKDFYKVPVLEKNWGNDSLNHVSTCIDWNDGSTRKHFKNWNLRVRTQRQVTSLWEAPNIKWQQLRKMKTTSTTWTRDLNQLSLMPTRNLASEVFDACHFSISPAGKVLAQSGLFIFRLMALYCLRLSAKGISVGSVIWRMASFCSGLKHFTLFVLSSPVLTENQISWWVEHNSVPCDTLFRISWTKNPSRNMVTVVDAFIYPRVKMPVTDTVLGCFLRAGRLSAIASLHGSGYCWRNLGNDVVIYMTGQSLLIYKLGPTLICRRLFRTRACTHTQN